MIIQAISDVRQSIESEVRGEPEGRCVMTYPQRYHNGVRVSCCFGPSAPSHLTQSDGFGPSAPSNLNQFNDFGRESAPLHTNYPGDALRPWVFGNWWKIEDSTNDHYSNYSFPQLIGIGVRVSNSPRIHDAEGNSEEKVTYRGSGSRIRIYDGRLKSLRILLLG